MSTTDKQEKQVHIGSNTNASSVNQEALSLISDREVTAMPSKTNCHGKTAKGQPCQGGAQHADPINHEHHSHFACGPTRKAITNGTFTGWQEDICRRLEAERGYPKAEQQPQLDLNTKPNPETYCFHCKEDFGSDFMLDMHNEEMSHNIPAKVQEKMAEESVVIAPVEWVNIVVFGGRPKDIANPTATQETLNSMGPRIKEKFPNAREICGACDGGDIQGARMARDNEIPFHLEIPHLQYMATYHHFSDEKWEAIKEASASRHYTVGKQEDEEGDNIPWHYSFNFKRNVAMANMGEHFVCVHNVNPTILVNRTYGGTSHMLRTLKGMGHTHICWINGRTGEESWVDLV